MLVEQGTEASEVLGARRQVRTDERRIGMTTDQGRELCVQLLK